MWEFDIKKKDYRFQRRFLNVPSGKLRISITSSCNMACHYCHAEGGHVESGELTLSEIDYIIEQSVQYGIKSIRLTGGEPLLHPHVSEICQHIKGKYHDMELGINTNGIAIDLLLEIIDQKAVDRVVVGIDYFNEDISKSSSNGLPSRSILENVLKIKEKNCRVDISTVYLNNYSNAKMMVEWCFSNSIRLKLIEIIDDGIDKKPTLGYMSLIKNLVEEFDLSLCLDMHSTQLYACDNIGNQISFFHSHCRQRECRVCSNLHMRVTSEGKIKPCLKTLKTEFSLLDNFEENMLKGLCYSGRTPEEVDIA